MSLCLKGLIIVHSVQFTLMKWYYESNGHPHGPVEEAQLRQLLQDGRIQGDSLVWRQGMLDWAPLNQVNDFSARPEPLHPPQLEAGSRVPTANSSPFDQLTAREEDSEPGPAAADLAPASTGERFQARPEWEHVPEKGPLGAFVVSLREICLDPGSTFRNIQRNGGWGLPLLFLLISEVIGNVMMVSTLAQIPSSTSPAINFLKHALQLEKGEILLYSCATSLLTLPLAIVLKAVIIHASLRLIGRSSQPFATTFRTLCYALGAGSMLWSIPLVAVSTTSLAGETAASVAAMFLGSFAISLWSLWITVTALAGAHALSLPRTAASLVLPPLVITITYILIFGLATLAGG